MATKVADLRADLGLNSASFESGMQKARREARQFQQNVQADLKSVESQFTRLSATAANFGRGLVAGVGIAGAAGIFGKMVTEVREAELATAKLSASLKAAGNSTGLSLAQINEATGNLARNFMVSGEAATEAAARLNSFGAVTGSRFKEVLALSADMSAAVGGDLTSSVDRLGKALVDPVEGLSAITKAVKAFNPAVADSAREMAKLGDVAGAQTAILAELSRVVGGSAKEQGETLAGSFHRAGEALGDFLERAANGTGIIAGLKAAAEAAAVGFDKLAQPTPASDTIRQKQQEVLTLTAKRDGPGLGGSAEEETQRKAAIDLRIARLRDEIDAITAASLAEQERAAIAEKAAQDAANFAQIKAKAEVKSIAETVVAEKGKHKVVVDLLAERQKREAAAAAEREKQRQGEMDSIIAAYREDERVALAVEEQKKKAAEDALREQKDAAKEMQAVWDDVAIQIKNALASGIRDGMEGEIQTAQQVATTIKDIFLTASSQIASMAIMNPAQFMQMTQGMGTFGSLAPSLFGGTALGGVSVGGTLGAVGIGAAAGGIGAGLLGMDSTGGSIGGGLGAGIGFAFGGPVGALIGGGIGTLGGGLLGGMFAGNGGEQNNNYRATFTDGAFVPMSNTKPDARNVEAITGVQSQLSALYTLLQASGGSFTGSLGLNAGNKDGLQLTTATGTRNFDDAAELSLAAARALIAGTEGLSNLDRRVANRSQATDAAGLVGDLQFARQFEEATGAVTPFVREIRALRQSFGEAREKAAELGLNVDKLKDAQAEQIRDIRLQFKADVGIITPFELEMARLKDRFDEQRKAAKELGVSIADVNRAQKQQLETVRAQKVAAIESTKAGYLSTLEGTFGFLDPIEELRRNFETTTGGGTARSRFREAQGEFERVQQQVEAGEVAGFEALPQVAQTLLNAARENFASGAGYAEVAAQVRDLLDSAAEQGEDATAGLRDGLGKVETNIKDLTAQMQQLLETTNSELKGLRREIRALDRAA